uniref:Ion transport domain-containing protein n=2 Tax=Ditylum brightwellii TaxID=49249 RepID=A0A7S4VK10_9STRA
MRGAASSQRRAAARKQRAKEATSRRPKGDALSRSDHSTVRKKSEPLSRSFSSDPSSNFSNNPSNISSVSSCRDDDGEDSSPVSQKSVIGRTVDKYPKLQPLHQRYLHIEPKIRRARDIAGGIVNDDRVQIFIIALIVINGIMLGIATFDFVTDDPAMENRFEIVDEVLLGIFTVELALQFIFHGMALFNDGWLVFDFIIIAVSYGLSSFTIVRAFRIFRALRLLTRVEVMKNLVSALLSVIPGMASIALLLSLVFYIFAVMFTSLFKDLWRDGDGPLEFNYFGTIWDSLFTCFQFMTLDDWNPIVREVMTERSWAWLPFITFIIFSGFIIVNLLIAVICDAVSMLQDLEKEKLTGGFYQGESDEDDDDDSFPNEIDDQMMKANSKRRALLNTISEMNSMRSLDSQAAQRRNNMEGGDDEHHHGGSTDDPKKMIQKSLGRNTKLLMAIGQAESQRLLLDIQNTERREIGEKVDVLDDQIQELFRLQRSGTKSIEKILKRLQHMSDPSDNDQFHDNIRSN